MCGPEGPSYVLVRGMETQTPQRILIATTTMALYPINICARRTKFLCHGIASPKATRSSHRAHKADNSSHSTAASTWKLEKIPRRDCILCSERVRVASPLVTNAVAQHSHWMRTYG